MRKLRVVVGVSLGFMRRTRTAIQVPGLPGYDSRPWLTLPNYRTSSRRPGSRRTVPGFVGFGFLRTCSAFPRGVEAFRRFPLGSILYLPDGRMSAQLSVGSPARLANDDPAQASVEEAAQAWRTYLGYWGTFKVFADKGVVVHRVEGSSFPNWIGTEQVRHFRFDGSSLLILSAQFSSGHRY